MKMFAEYLKDEMEIDRMNGGGSDESESDQAQDDFELYEEFVKWLDGKVANDLKAELIHGEAYIVTASGTIWITDGKIESSSKVAREPWQLLWDIWQAELQA